MRIASADPGLFSKIHATIPGILTLSILGGCAFIVFRLCGG
jgi:hypothetical protein